MPLLSKGLKPYVTVFVLHCACIFLIVMTFHISCILDSEEICLLINTCSQKSMYPWSVYIIGLCV